MKTSAWLVLLAFCTALGFFLGVVGGIHSHMNRVERMKQIEEKYR